MKTFREFMSEADIMRQMRAISYGSGAGARQSVPFVQTHPARSAMYARAAKALAPKPTMPTSAAGMIGIGLGKGVLAPAAVALASRNRQQQVKKYTSMMAPEKGESGYYGTGRVAKITKR